MRKLQKSSPIWGVCAVYQALLPDYRHNTSSKPYARLMHSLASLTFGQRPPNCFPNLSAPSGPNRAERRAKFIADSTLPVPYVAVAEEPRKLTGAVRRGLERGRTA